MSEFNRLETNTRYTVREIMEHIGMPDVVTDQGMKMRVRIGGVVASHANKLIRLQGQRIEIIVGRDKYFIDLDDDSGTTVLTDATRAVIEERGKAASDDAAVQTMIKSVAEIIRSGGEVPEGLRQYQEAGKQKAIDDTIAILFALRDRDPKYSPEPGSFEESCLAEAIKRGLV